MTDCFCDYDPPDWCSSHTYTARKEHRCKECRAVIRKGERYEYVVGKWEGMVGQFKTCARCLAVRQYVTDMVPCFCWAHGNLLQDALDTIDEYRPELPGLWFGWARRHTAAIKHARASRMPA